jgi:hypothetical protein
LAQFFGEKDAFGKPPALPKRGQEAYVMVEVTSAMMEASLDAHNKMCLMMHAFWGLNWLQARAVCLVARKPETTVLCLASELVDEFNIHVESENLAEWIIQECILPLTQRLCERPWLVVDQRGRLLVSQMIRLFFRHTTLECDEMSEEVTHGPLRHDDLIDALLPHLLFSKESLGPLVPCMVVNSQYGRRVSEAQLRGYIQEQIGQLNIDVPKIIPLQHEKDHGLRIEPTGELRLPPRISMDDITKVITMSAAEEAGFCNWVCPAPALPEIKKVFADLMAKHPEMPVLCEMMGDEGTVIRFQNEKAYVDWWIRTKLDRIADVFNHAREGTGLLAHAKTFVGQIFFNTVVEEAREDKDGNWNGEIVTKRLFYGDDSYEEKLASLTQRFSREHAPILAELPSYVLSNTYAMPYELPQVTISAREIYSQHLRDQIPLYA